MSDWDVFISYSHIDNMSGWVNKFYTKLYIELSEKLGRKAEIFQYERHQPGNAKKVMPNIIEHLERSTVFIPILSPSYKNSATCGKEFKRFENQNNEDHIFPVAKSLIEFDDMIVSYKFYRDDSKEVNIDNEITESIKIDPDNDERDFGNLIEKLSIKIARFIKGLEQVEESPLIYLAKPSPDMEDEYENIKLDLEGRKNDFIPLEIEPYKQPDPEKFKNEIRKDIQQCKLSVQIIGEQNSPYPKASSKSYLQLQNEVAAERDGKEPDFKRLIWLPKYKARDNAKPKDFIKEVRNVNSKNVEVIYNPSIEYFKGQIQDNLEALKPKPKPPIPVPSGESPFVYLIYDRSDSETADKLGQSIHSETGFGIWGSDTYFDPSLNGSERTEFHDFLLETCKAVVIYWCSAPRKWLVQNIADVLRVPRTRAKAVFIDKKGNRFYPPGGLESINGYPELPNLLNILGGQN